MPKAKDDDEQYQSDGARRSKNEQDWPDDVVRSFKAWCEASGFSSATGRRLIAADEGPVITRLSARRIGIRGRHHRAWLDQRARKTGGTP